MISYKKKLWLLFWNFFKISAVCVGGGLTMIPVVEARFVKKYNLISDEDLIDGVALSQAMPGIIITNIASYLGMKIAGYLGAFAAFAGVVLPPFITIILILMLLNKIGGIEQFSSILVGVRAAVAALILIYAVNLAKKLLKGYLAKIYAISSFVLLTFTAIDAILVIVAGGVLSVIFTYFNLIKVKSEVKK